VKKLLMIAALVAAPTAFAADDALPYTYIGINSVSVDTGFGGSETGLSVDGSIALDDSVYFVASLGELDSDSTITLGLGFHGEISENFDFIGELNVVSTESGNGPERGFAIGVGLRGAPTEHLELFGRIDHVDIDNFSDQSLTFGALYYFGRVGVGAQFSSSDNADGTAIGVRFTF
jgi:hypothetical protein